MTKKLRVTITFVREYEPDMRDYPGCDTLKEALALDIEGAKEEPYVFIDNNLTKMTVTGEIV